MVSRRRTSIKHVTCGKTRRTYRLNPSTPGAAWGRGGIWWQNRNISIKSATSARSESTVAIKKQKKKKKKSFLTTANFLSCLTENNIQGGQKLPQFLTGELNFSEKQANRWSFNSQELISPSSWDRCYTCWLYRTARPKITVFHVNGIICLLTVNGPRCRTKNNRKQKLS